MRKYALIKNNIVAAIVQCEESDVSEAIKGYDLIIDIENELPQPEVGYILVGNKLKAANPIDANQRIELILEMRFKFGNALADTLVKKMSKRNLALIAAGQVLNINIVIQNFTGVEAALRKCAIPTAKSAVQSLLVAYPEYTEEFSYAIAEMSNYLATESVI